MPQYKKLVAAAPWVELRLSTQERRDADPDILLALLGQAIWIRSFEEYVLELASEGLVHGPAHSSISQEGGAVGSVLPLQSDDFVNG